jgi:hypothetical protein
MAHRAQRRPVENVGSARRPRRTLLP